MIPVTSIEMVCSGCGARNRIGNYSVQHAPICGRCAMLLPEKQSVALQRALWRSRRGLVLSLCFFIAAAVITSLAVNESQKPIVMCDTAQPDTGRYARYDRSPLIAPLTIRTQPGSNYFLKIEEVGTKRPIMTIFIAGGGTIQQNMPAGLFKLKFATGDKWCGEQRLFGSDTAINETGSLFTFDDEHTYSVDLSRQRNGNLPVRTISLRDF